MSAYKPAASNVREQFPEVAEMIGEDPARYLDTDLVSGEGVQDDTFESRVRGIDRLEVIQAWIEIETSLERGPRRHVIARLNRRKRELEENGERDLPGRTHEELVALSDEADADETETVWRHEPCGSTDVVQESAMAWFCDACEQRTNRVEEVEA